MFKRGWTTISIPLSVMNTTRWTSMYSFKKINKRALMTIIAQSKKVRFLSFFWHFIVDSLMQHKIWRFVINPTGSVVQLWSDTMPLNPIQHQSTQVIFQGGALFLFKVLVCCFKALLGWLWVCWVELQELRVSECVGTTTFWWRLDVVVMT